MSCHSPASDWGGSARLDRALPLPSSWYPPPLPQASSAPGCRSLRATTAVVCPTQPVFLGFSCPARSRVKGPGVRRRGKCLTRLHSGQHQHPAPEAVQAAEMDLNLDLPVRTHGEARSCFWTTSSPCLGTSARARDTALP